MTKILAEVLAANAKYAENFGNKGNLPLPPSRAPGLSRVRAVLALARIDLALRDRYLIVPPCCFARISPIPPPTPPQRPGRG
jgi:hypothetical protein